MDSKRKLEELIEKGQALLETKATRSTPEFSAWRTSVKRTLTDCFGSDSEEYRAFNSRVFSPTMMISGQNYDMAKYCGDGIKTTLIELREYLSEIDNEEHSKDKHNIFVDNGKVFIVHGHDGELKEAVARVIEKQGLDAVILSEKENRGKTIIEKIENYSDVGAAVILFTADDTAKNDGEGECVKRARQNVVFEAGYFMGAIGRGNVVIIADGDVEMPSDLAGVVYTNKVDWKTELLKELNAMGFNIDFNKLYK